MNVPEWTQDFSIEDVIVRCVEHMLPQIDANYVDRYLSRRPLPALQAVQLIRLGIMKIQALPIDTREAIAEEFRRRLYLKAKEALDASIVVDVAVPGAGVFRRKDPFRDITLSAMYLRWAPVFITLHIVLGLRRGKYPTGNELDGTV